MKLKEYRMNCGFTQKEVADKIYCTSGVYARYEREEREPSIEILKLLADLYRTSIDKLVGHEINKIN